MTIRTPSPWSSVLIVCLASIISPAPAVADPELLVCPIPNEGGFGKILAAVPDADGDGYTDLLASGYQIYVPGAPGNGSAFLYSGATGALLFQFISPRPQDGGGEFSFHVAGVPDTDGDGRGDVLVGAHGEHPDGSPVSAGRAHLFSGATGQLLYTMMSPEESFAGNFGYPVAGVPDLDGDGRGDLLISENRVGEPRLHVFSGAGGVILYTLVSPNQPGTNDFATALLGLPDLDGDGLGEFAVGSPAEDLSADLTRAGRVYIFSGADGTVLHTLTSLAPEVTGLFGYSLAGLPDLTGDGVDDLAVYAGVPIVWGDSR